MSNRVLIFVCILSLYLGMFSPTNLVASSPPKQQTAERNSTDIESTLNRIKDDIKEIRRDQLNYKIEKDVMKELYSSNLQIINIVIAIVVSIFGFLGFFGLRDINSIQKSYKKELDKLVRLKSDFETEIKQISEEQRKVKETYDDIIKTNEIQNNKIKLLELRDKAHGLFKDKNYSNAIEYCGLGLELDSKNIPLLFIKSMSFFKQRRYSNAINICNEIIDVDPNNFSAKSNLCELYLLAKEKDKFDLVYKDLKVELAEKYNGILNSYFEAFKYYIDDNSAEIKNIMKKFIDTCEPGKKKRTTWDFSDFAVFLKKQPVTEGKNLISNFISFLDGEKDKDEILSILN